MNDNVAFYAILECHPTHIMCYTCAVTVSNCPYCRAKRSIYKKIENTAYLINQIFTCLKLRDKEGFTDAVLHASSKYVDDVLVEMFALKPELSDSSTAIEWFKTMNVQSGKVLKYLSIYEGSRENVKFIPRETRTAANLHKFITDFLSKCVEFFAEETAKFVPNLKLKSKFCYYDTLHTTCEVDGMRMNLIQTWLYYVLLDDDVIEYLWNLDWLTEHERSIIATNYIQLIYCIEMDVADVHACKIPDMMKIRKIVDMIWFPSRRICKITDCLSCLNPGCRDCGVELCMRCIKCVQNIIKDCISYEVLYKVLESYFKTKYHSCDAKWLVDSYIKKLVTCGTLSIEPFYINDIDDFYVILSEIEKLLKCRRNSWLSFEYIYNNLLWVVSDRLSGKLSLIGIDYVIMSIKTLADMGYAKIRDETARWLD